MERSFSDTELINFLQDELAISNSEIDIVLRHHELHKDPLPMLLWQYGLVSLEQLARIFDWLECKSQFNFSRWALTLRSSTLVKMNLTSGG